MCERMGRERAEVKLLGCALQMLLGVKLHHVTSFRQLGTGLGSQPWVVEPER